jgi:hypothetical protein
MKLARVLIVTSLFFACSKSSDSSSPSTKAQAATCEEAAPVYCKKLFACSPEEGRELYGTIERCQLEDAAICHQIAELPGASAKSIEGWVACENAIAKLTCDELKWGGYFPACAPAAGTYKTSQPCVDDFQCEGLRCESKPPPGEIPLSQIFCGTCAARAGEGGACENDSGCVWGTACSGGKCVKPAAEGQPCQDMSACLFNLRCVDGTCRKASALGGPCQVSSDCVNWWAECSAQGVCAVAEGPGQGEPCEPDGPPDNPPPSCRGSNFCDPATKRCVPAKIAGEACATILDCGYLLDCQGGKCVPLTEAVCR